MTTTTTMLPGGDAVELGELLGFLHDWLSTDTDVAVSLRRFTFGLISPDEVRSDLARFASALGVDTGTDRDRDKEGDEW
jgi:hypothetical protein